MNTFDRFTSGAQQAIQSAYQYVQEFGNSSFEPIHLMYALVVDQASLASTLLNMMHLNRSVLIHDLKNTIGMLPQISGATAQPPVSQALQQTFVSAESIAKEMDDAYVTVEHLLLALIRTDSKIASLLAEQDITYERTAETTAQIRKGRKVTNQNHEQTFDALAKYGKDITSLAEAGELDPIIGREEETRRAIQILSRRTKNNPVLVGEPGVGKTAIIE